MAYYLVCNKNAKIVTFKRICFEVCHLYIIDLLLHVYKFITGGGVTIVFIYNIYPPKYLDSLNIPQVKVIVCVLLKVRCTGKNEKKPQLWIIWIATMVSIVLSL